LYHFFLKATGNHTRVTEMTSLAKHGYGKVAVVMLMLLVLAIPAQRIIAQSPAASSETCSTAVLAPKVQAAAAQVSLTAAQQAAASTLAAYESEYSVSYNSFFDRFTWSTSCSVTVQSVNVAYDLSSKAGNYTLQISMNPALTAVIGVTEYPAQTAGIVYSPTENNASWSGPEYYDSHGMEEAESEWTVPTIEGSGGQACLCSILEWTGLAENQYGGPQSSPHLAQAGTQTYCDSPCSSTENYYLFYDFPDDPLEPCSSVSPGDTITTDIYPWDGYAIADSFDWTQNPSEGCYGQSSSGYLGTPYWAEYMLEKNTNNGIPQISEVSFTDSFYEDGTGSSYYISNSWNNAYILNDSTSDHTCNGNSVNWNICPSGVSSGSFSETWLTSSGTG
jgi:hypothetical protein